MAREGLRYELTNAFHRALRQEATVALEGLRIGSNAGEEFVNITVQRLEEPEQLRGLVMVVFADVAAPLETKAAARVGKPGKTTVHKIRLAELERRHQQVCMELQTTREEMQSSQDRPS